MSKPIVYGPVVGDFTQPKLSIVQIISRVMTGILLVTIGGVIGVYLSFQIIQGYIDVTLVSPQNKSVVLTKP